MATQRETRAARRLELVNCLAQTDVPAPLLDAVSAELHAADPAPAAPAGPGRATATAAPTAGRWPVDATTLTDEQADPAHGQLFTLRLTFEAGSHQQAKELAARYAEALSLMRTEVLMFSAQVSEVRTGSEPEQVFCRTTGPYGLTCTGIAGHFGWHNAAASGPS